MVELVKILEERYKQQNGIDEIGEAHKYSVPDYKKDRRNELTQLFKDLGLEDSLDLFKTIEGKKAKAYCFFEDEVDFINRLYDEYSGPLVAVRKKQFMDLDDEYAVKLYEDILGLFTHRGLTIEAAYEKTRIAYNILDYPIRKKQLVITRLQHQMERVTNLIMEERLRNITSRNDDFAWIDYVSKQMEEKVNDFIHLYDVMAELRQCEINDYAEERYMNMTKEELEQMEEEEFFGFQTLCEWKALPRVKKLLEEKRRITGEPAESRELMRWIPRTDYTLKELKTLKNIEHELKKLYSETEVKVQKQAIAGKELQPIFEKQIEYGFKGLRSSEQLLEAALEEIKCENECLGVKEGWQYTPAT